MTTELDKRCANAIQDLAELARQRLENKDVVEYNRLKGKMEGVRLAQDYANQIEAAEIIRLRKIDVKCKALLEKWSTIYLKQMNDNATWEACVTKTYIDDLRKALED